MPKVLVTRWRRKRPVYMSPIKRMETIISNDEAQYIAVQDIVLDILSNTSNKSKVGRPRKTNAIIPVVQ